MLEARPVAHDHSPWMQFDIALFAGSDAAPHFPWAALAQEISEWRAAERFELFHFTRKPPGLRLRFAGRNLAMSLEPLLLVWLTSAERHNDIRSFRRVVYEPETHRFGGDLGMALAHRHFDADSALVLAYERSEPRPDETVRRRRVLALTMIVDLLARSLGDDAEAWDVLKRLEAAIDIDLSSPGSDEVADVNEILHGPTNDPSESELLRRSGQTNASIAEHLQAAVRGGELAVGPRTWLTAAATFQWNRWGLPVDLGGLAQVVTELARRYAPDQLS